MFDAVGAVLDSGAFSFRHRESAIRARAAGCWGAAACRSAGLVGEELRTERLGGVGATPW